METYGECPTLTGKLAIPFVRGSQGNDMSGASLDRNGTWLAGSCCKHYAAYDLESYPIDRGHFSANVSARDMFEYYLPPFHDCIATAEAMHVMTALNAINGVAASADPELVDGLLRNFSDSWGFTGFVVTDYGG
jgi:beta-glucosidase